MPIDRLTPQHGGVGQSCRQERTVADCGVVEALAGAGSMNQDASRVIGRSMPASAHAGHGNSSHEKDATKTEVIHTQQHDAIFGENRLEVKNMTPKNSCFSPTYLPMRITPASQWDGRPARHRHISGTGLSHSENTWFNPVTIADGAIVVPGEASCQSPTHQKRPWPGLR